MSLVFVEAEKKFLEILSDYFDNCDQARFSIVLSYAKLTLMMYHGGLQQVDFQPRPGRSLIRLPGINFSLTHRAAIIMKDF